MPVKSAGKAYAVPFFSLPLKKDNNMTHTAMTLFWLATMSACSMAPMTPKAPPAAGARYLAEFIEQMKASGFVANALTRHGITGAAIAPPAAARGAR